MPELPDSELVVRAQQGDLNAMGMLYDQHYKMIFRYLRARVGDQLLAEDLTGDVFRRMLTGLPQYRSLGLPFRAWLFRIAHNLMIDHYRQESGREMASLDEDKTESQPQGEDDPAVVLEQKLRFENAHRALSELEQFQREVLALRFLGGLSLRETALALNKTEDAVKALQRRGLIALRLTLTEEQP